MFWYVVIVSRDGSTQTIQAEDKSRARDIFDRAVRRDSTVYAHYAEIYCERDNWYCKAE